MKRLVKAVTELENDPYGPKGRFGGAKVTVEEIEALRNVILEMAASTRPPHGGPEMMSKVDTTAVLAIGLLLTQCHIDAGIIGRAGELADQLIRHMPCLIPGCSLHHEDLAHAIVADQLP